MTVAESGNEFEGVDADTVTAIEKYKTIGRAVKMDDPVAASLMYKHFKKDTGKDLSKDEKTTLGLSWFNAKSEKPEMIDFLEEIGFDFNSYVLVSKTETVGEPIAFRLIGNDHLENILENLISRNLIDVGCMDSMCGSMVQHALMHGRFDFADKLKSFGADLDQANLAGETALHTCASKLNFKGCQWLLENGADPTIMRMDQTRAAELVPEGEHDGFDGDVLYNEIINAIEAYESGAKWSPGEEFLASVAQEEAMYKEAAEASKPKSSKPKTP